MKSVFLVKAVWRIWIPKQPDDEPPAATRPFINLWPCQPNMRVRSEQAALRLAANAYSKRTMHHGPLAFAFLQLYCAYKPTLNDMTGRQSEFLLS